MTHTGNFRRRRAVMIYAGDGLGLGHLRRYTHIASRLAHGQADARILILTSLPLGCPFDVPPGVDVVKLPSVRKLPTGDFAPRTLSGDKAELMGLRTALIRSAAREFRPDMFLVDHLPLGIHGELLPVLRELKPHAAIVLGLRDIVDAPGVTRDRWRREGALEAIDALYDEILIYGCRQVFDASALYGLEARVSTPVRYCGYVCAEETPARIPAGAEEHWGAFGRRVLVTAGGGIDGYPMMRLCVEALRRASKVAALSSVFVTGPFMPRESRKALEAAVRGETARVLWRTDQLPTLLGSADLVVTMAGYNTLVETIRLERRPLVIPRRGPSAEQRMRAELFADRGLVRAVDPDAASPDLLTRLVLEGLEDGELSGELPDMSGLSRATRHLDALLEGSSFAGRSNRSAGDVPRAESAGR